MFYVPDNADDGYPVDLRISRPTNAFAERIFIHEILPHHGVVCDANQRCFFNEILRPKITTQSHWNLHGVKVIAHHTASFQAGFIAGRKRGPAVDHKIVVERIAAQRQFTDERGLHPG